MKLSRREFLGLAGVLGLSSCVHVKLPLVGGGQKGPFQVAAMNDLHVVDARSTAIVNHAIEQINRTEQIRFTVVLGDLTGNGKLSELNLAKKSLDRLKMPYLALPGNHDVEPRASNVYGNMERVFGKIQWRREEDDWVFIGLNSCENDSSDVTIPPERTEWLQKQLRHVKPKQPIALFAHHPFNPHTKQYRIKNADEVLGLFSGHNLKLVASGHWHGNQVEEENGILFTTTACCSSTRTNFDDTSAKGYRLFRFEGDRVETEFVEVAM
jgi:3',5'-cyclic AMP phosphodiesterase CpdA